MFQPFPLLVRRTDSLLLVSTRTKLLYLLLCKSIGAHHQFPLKSTMRIPLPLLLPTYNQIQSLGSAQNNLLQTYIGSSLFLIYILRGPFCSMYKEGKKKKANKNLHYLPLLIT